MQETAADVFTNVFKLVNAHDNFFAKAMETISTRLKAKLNDQIHAASVKLKTCMTFNLYTNIHICSFNFIIILLLELTNTVYRFC